MIAFENDGYIPLIAIGGFNLDFLCVHPFRDGNGRVSRLLLLCVSRGEVQPLGGGTWGAANKGTTRKYGY